MTHHARTHARASHSAARLTIAACLALGFSALLRPPAAAAPAVVLWPSISLVSVVGGLSQPVFVTHADDGSGRLFIVEQAGRIRIYQSGSLLAAAFLDISSTSANAAHRRVKCCGEEYIGPGDGGAWQSLLLLDSPHNISSFGEDQAGNLFLSHLGGTIYQVRAASQYADPAGACGGNAPCHATLQAAINAAGTNVGVTAYPGMYNESATLNKNIGVSLLPGSHDRNGSLTLSSGVFFAPGETLSVSGNFSLGANSAFNHGNGTVVFDGSGVQAVSGSPTFYNLTIAAGSTVDTGAAPINVLGTLTNNGVLQSAPPAQTVTTGGGPANFADPLGKTTVRLTSTGGASLGSTTVAVTAHQSPETIGCGALGAGVAPVLRHLNITPANTAGVAATVRLFYDHANEANGNNADNLAIYHCDGTAWTRLSGSYSTGQDAVTGYNYVELTNVTQFSPFAIGSPGVPTAARLTAFTARPGGRARGLALVAGLALASTASLSVRVWRRSRRRSGG